MNRNLRLGLLSFLGILVCSACNKENETRESPAPAADNCRLHVLETRNIQGSRSLAIYWEEGRIAGYGDIRYEDVGGMLLVMNPSAPHVRDTLLVDRSLRILERRKTERPDTNIQRNIDPSRSVVRYLYDGSGTLVQQIWEFHAYDGVGGFIHSANDTAHFSFEQGDLVRLIQGSGASSQVTEFEYSSDTLPKEYVSYQQLLDGGSAFTSRNRHLLKRASTGNGNYMVDYIYEKDKQGRITAATTVHQARNGSAVTFTEHYDYTCK